MNAPQILHGNNLDLLRQMPDCSVDSIVTDPPYELGFMGKKWDSTGIAYSVELWSECLRVLKHGGHLLAFSSSRTYHRMAVAIEDSGFQIRDQIMWVYGSGFPKSHSVIKGLENNSDAAREWSGWGTALKPAHEPIVMARKPLEEKTVPSNVLKHRTGAINIDACRIGIENGRFPSNFIHDGSDEVIELMPDTGSGSAARFFYCAKAGKAERNAGLDALDEQWKAAAQFRPNHMDKALEGESGNPFGRFQPTKNFHPTVKPVALMRYLVRLVTPPHGTVLDPFTGSGTTLVAAVLEGLNSIGMEMTADYLPIIEGRVSWALLQEPEQPTLF